MVFFQEPAIRVRISTMRKSDVDTEEVLFYNVFLSPHNNYHEIEKISSQAEVSYTKLKSSRCFPIKARISYVDI